MRIRNIVIILVFIYSNCLYSQTFEVQIDTIQFRKHSGNGDHYNSLKQNLNISLNGQKLSFDNPNITITQSINKLDTLIWFHKQNLNRDTILCKFEKNQTYKVTFNPCCNYFNIKKSTNDLSSKINFRVLNFVKSSKILLVHGETIQIVSDSNVYMNWSACNSAMDSKWQNFELIEFEECEDLSECEDELCVLENGQIYSRELKWKRKKVLFSINLLNLESKEIEIEFDMLSQELNIQK